jgi:hypothetical protein
MLRSKFLSLLGLLAVGGAGALYGFTGTSKPAAKAATCGCCVADLCTCAPCVCSCEGPCGEACDKCAECCATCPGCASTTAAALTSEAATPAACASGCCAQNVAK